MSNPPSISVQLAVNPPRFSPGSRPMPTISATATSHATRPITIFTWSNLFNLSLAQRRDNFTCLDLTTNTPIRMDVTKGPRRTGVYRVLGSHDDRYFCTLEPETPVTFTAPFKFAFCDSDNPSSGWPAHKYRLAVNEERGVSWWRYGRKWNVLALPGRTEVLGEPSGPPIQLMPVAPVDFEIVAPSTSSDLDKPENAKEERKPDGKCRRLHHLAIHTMRSISRRERQEERPQEKKEDAR